MSDRRVDTASDREYAVCTPARFLDSSVRHVAFPVENWPKAHDRIYIDIFRATIREIDRNINVIANN